MQCLAQRRAARALAAGGTGLRVAFIVSRMEQPVGEQTWGTRLKSRFGAVRLLLWSWLTDPAVLLYRREAHGRKRARVIMVEFFLFVREVSREFYDIQGTSRAASLAYTTLLSLIPLLVAFTQALQRYFHTLFPNFQSQIDSVLNVIIPYQSPVLTYHLARFAENAEAASTFGVIIFIIIAFRLFLAVEATINQIWKERSARGYRQKIMAFTMLFFWGPVLMGLSFTSTNMLEKNRYLRFFFQHDLTFRIVPIVVLFIAFTMLFWLVPSTHVRLRSAALGALVTTAAFTLVRFLFGVYADYLFHGRFNVIYGSLGLAIIFLIAIEVMWVVILVGVEVSYVYQNLYGVLRATEQLAQDEPRFDLYYALRALIEIARRFDRREDGPSSYRLAEQFGTTDSQMVRVLRKLEDQKLVKEVGGDWTGFVPGCDPDHISIEEVVLHMEGGQRSLPDLSPDDPERAAIASLFNRLTECTKNALDHLSVGQLVRQLYAPRGPTRIEDRASGG
jgi:membrane protein